METEDRVLAYAALTVALVLGMFMYSCTKEDTKRYGKRQETCQKAIEAKNDAAVREVCR